MYTYWTAVQKEEHMLYAKEVAAGLGIYSLGIINKVKVASLLATKLLNEATAELEAEEYFYHHKNGLSRVYPKEVIARAAQKLADDSLKNGSVYSIAISGKIYKYSFHSELHSAFVQLSPESYDENGSYITEPEQLALRKIQLGKRLNRYDKKHLERITK